MEANKREKTCAELVQGEWYVRQEELEKYEANGWHKFHEYGLSFDYVEADTFDNQPKGYHRFQISWGGPSDELRFYSLDKVEYWYMDWFDGASIDVTDEVVIKDLYDYFDECGLIEESL